MKTMSTAVLSKIIKLSVAEYKALTASKTKTKKKGGIADITGKLKPGEAFHVTNVTSVPSHAYLAAKQNGFKVSIRPGLSHIGQTGFWVVRKHG